MKRLISAFLATALFVALAACSPGEEKPEDGHFLAKVLEAN